MTNQMHRYIRKSQKRRMENTKSEKLMENNIHQGQKCLNTQVVTEQHPTDVGEQGRCKTVGSVSKVVQYSAVMKCPQILISHNCSNIYMVLIFSLWEVFNI